MILFEPFCHSDRSLSAAAMASFYMRLLWNLSPPFLSAHLPYHIHGTLSNLALCLPCCSSSSPHLQSEGDRLDQRNAGRHWWPRLGIGQTGGKTDCPTRLVMTSGGLSQCKRYCVLAECGCRVCWEQWHRRLVLLDPQISCLWGFSFPWEGLGGSAVLSEQVLLARRLYRKHRACSSLSARPGYRRTHSFVCV